MPHHVRSILRPFAMTFILGLTSVTAATPASALTCTFRSAEDYLVDMINTVAAGGGIMVAGTFTEVLSVHPQVCALNVSPLREEIEERLAPTFDRLPIEELPVFRLESLFGPEFEAYGVTDIKAFVQPNWSQDDLAALSSSSGTDIAALRKFHQMLQDAGTFPVIIPAPPLTEAEIDDFAAIAGLAPDVVEAFLTEVVQGDSFSPSVSTACASTQTNMRFVGTRLGGSGPTEIELTVALETNCGLISGWGCAPRPGLGETPQFFLFKRSDAPNVFLYEDRGLCAPTLRADAESIETAQKCFDDPACPWRAQYGTPDLTIMPAPTPRRVESVPAD